ncbi:MAG: hypothetical protein JWN25_2321 [Verrucomicrobiales bacterium]|nr:hypothetical protein [Verrucomicrobiales bacterium]
MNRKQLLVLLVIVAIVGAVGWMVYSKGKDGASPGGQRVGEKLLGTFEVNDVAHIVIKQLTNELNLVRKGDLWVVKERGDYPANFSEISDFVRKMSDLKVVQTEEVGPSQYARLELLPPGKGGSNSATEVVFLGAGDKPIKDFLLGKKQMRKGGAPGPMGDEGGFPVGRFVLTPPSQLVAIISDPVSSAEAKPEQWIQKEFIKVEKIKAVSLISTNATNSWSVTRDSEAGEWKLANAKADEQLDAGKTGGLGTAFSSVSFSDVQPASQMTNTGLEKGQQITIETFDNFKYHFVVGDKTPEDNYYLTVKISGDFKDRTAAKDEKPEDKAKLDKEHKDSVVKLQDKLKQEKTFESWIFLVPKWSVDAVLKDRSQLMAEKKDPSTNGPAPSATSPLNIK